MIRKYNTQTGWLGRIQNDSEALTFRENEVKLQVIINAAPEYNSFNQRLERSEVLDVDNLEWRVEYTVIDLTPYEIAMREWEGGDLQLKIIAPIQLILDDFGVKMKGWFELKGLPILPKGEFVHLYCNVIEPQFQDAFDNLLAQEIIEIQERPKEEDFE